MAKESKPRGRPQNPPRSTFEKRLRKLMVAAEIASYAELSRRSGVSAATVQEACSGVYKPSVETLVALSDALNCTVDDLLRWK